ncbi:isomerizing glutamine--fructose-6-phosphate transaminase [Leptolyngbya sp. FACHB-36]|nr:isomerizing glutamine--fructose-6-phosphate transaminase [Leptolyngbya sp. FACHB-36]
MLKEIYQQPEVVRTCLAHYLNSNPDRPFNLPDRPIPNQIHLLACGTSWHACLIAQHWLEQIAGIPTRVRAASEFVAAPFPPTSNILTIAATQSGETADTLAAVQLARHSQTHLFGITNQPESSLSQIVDRTLLTHAGREIGVAATKTFLTQLLVFYCLTLDFAHQRQQLSGAQMQDAIAKLHALPDHITTLLQQDSAIQTLAQSFATAEHCIVLGRGIQRPIALEGALKLKETTYLHAEGYAAGEFMHGPIALLDARIPVIVLAPAGSVYPDTLANVRKIKANGASVLGIVTAGGEADFDRAIVLPSIDESLSPFLSVIPLQLLAYHLAVLRGLDVDRPRNITKTLTE